MPSFKGIKHGEEQMVCLYCGANSVRLISHVHVLDKCLSSRICIQLRWCWRLRDNFCKTNEQTNKKTKTCCHFYLNLRFSCTSFISTLKFFFFCTCMHAYLNAWHTQTRQTKVKYVFMYLRGSTVLYPKSIIKVYHQKPSTIPFLTPTWEGACVP